MLIMSISITPMKDLFRGLRDEMIQDSFHHTPGCILHAKAKIFITQMPLWAMYTVELKEIHLFWPKLIST